MSSFFRRSVTATVLLAGLALPVIAPAAQNVAVIEQRRAIYKQTADAFKAIKAAVEAKAAPSTVTPLAQTVAGNLEKVAGLFPADSKSGGETKALPEVWINTTAFTNNFKAAQAAAETLVLATKQADPAVLAASFQALAKACGTCHDGFRAK